MTYSQYNEEPFLLNYFKDKRDGLFVDLGSNNGWKGSNTYALFERGWSGVFVEADPSTYTSLLKTLSRFSQKQWRAFNLVIWDKEHAGDVVRFWSHNVQDSGLSSVQGNQNGMLPLQVQCETIDWVMDQLTVGTTVDFLAIDIEGCDMQALRDYSFRVKPKLIMAEMNATPGPIRATKEDYEALLTPHGYRCCFMNPTNIAFEIL